MNGLVRHERVRCNKLVRCKWLDEQKELIITLYEIGFTIREIATYFKVSDTPIIDRLLEWGVKLRSGNKLKDIQVDEYYGECFDKILRKLMEIRRKRLAKARSNQTRQRYKKGGDRYEY